MLNAQQMHIRRIVTNSNNHRKKKILWFHHCIPNSTTTDSDTHIRLNITLTSLMFTNSELYQMQQCLHCRYIFNMVVNSDLSSTSLSFLILASRHGSYETWALQPQRAPQIAKIAPNKLKFEVSSHYTTLHLKFLWSLYICVS